MTAHLVTVTRCALSDMRRIPDKLIALFVFLVLLGVYLYTRDDVVRRLLDGSFVLLCAGLHAGFQRMSDAFSFRQKAKRQPQGKAEDVS